MAVYRVAEAFCSDLGEGTSYLQASFSCLSGCGGSASLLGLLTTGLEGIPTQSWLRLACRLDLPQMML